MKVEAGPRPPRTPESDEQPRHHVRRGAGTPRRSTLYEETLVLRKAKLGPDHPDTLRTMNNLAITYHALGREAEALELREKTLALHKAKLGPDHPDTLGSMIGLAGSYMPWAATPRP